MQNFDARQKARSEEVDALNEATMEGKTGEDTRYQGMHFRYIRIYIYIFAWNPLMTSIFEGQPHKTRPFPFKTRVIWVPGIKKYQRFDGDICQGGW